MAVDLRGTSRSAFDGWERFASRPIATAAMVAWAFAEATVWPIIPDFLLAPLVAGNRRRFVVPLLASILGSALGGALTVLSAHWAPDQAQDVLRQLPTVSEAQIQGAERRLDQLGILAFLIQPWSGIPYKVFGVVAGAGGLHPWLVIPTSILGRALRMVLVAALARFVAGLFRHFIRDFSILVLAFYTAAFLYGWWLVLP